MNQICKISILLILFVVFNCSGSSASSQNAQKYLSQNQQQAVYYNTNSHIFHKLSCIHASRCTKNCILIPKVEALQLGRACKVCGG
jgi:hypothetical protein